VTPTFIFLLLFVIFYLFSAFYPAQYCCIHCKRAASNMAPARRNMHVAQEQKGHGSCVSSRSLFFLFFFLVYDLKFAPHCSPQFIVGQGKASILSKK